MTARGWLRRNTAALIATAVLLPVTGLVVGADKWWDANQGAPVFATEVATGDQVTWAGATWGPATARWAQEDPAAGLPDGARVLLVEVAVDPKGRGILCATPQLQELTGAGRHWADAIGDLDWAYEQPSACSSELTTPFTIEVPFLVPDDVGGPLGVDFSLADQLPGFLRLVVVP